MRTLRTLDGGAIPDRRVVNGLPHGILRDTTRNRPSDQCDDERENLAMAMKVVKNPAALLEAFDALETAWTPQSRTGFEPEGEAAAGL